MSRLPNSLIDHSVQLLFSARSAFSAEKTSSFPDDAEADRVVARPRMEGSLRTPPAETFQELLLRLMTFWGEQGCLLTQPFDAEKGAGTYNPSTFLRSIGPEPWRAAYVEPSRRPTDGRYGENPNRLYRHHQFQVLLKPSPPDLQGLYLRSLRAIGIHPEEHDIRFVEDNWESPTLGAWGLGWEVWIDGMEATQFTYFQQCGGLECRPVSGELTYGMERLAMYLQDVDDVYELAYAHGVKYGDVFRQDEVEYSKLSFEALDVDLYLDLYEKMEKETERLIGTGLVIPAYDHLLHAAHAFNALDAKGSISVTERQAYILRIRDLAKMTAEAYLESREQLGFPLGRAEDPETLPERISVQDPGVDGPLFVELGTEELPASEIGPAAKALADHLIAGLDGLRLGHGSPRVFATPRRLAVLIPEVESRQADRSVEVAGPPVQAAFKDGKPTKAAQGFAKGQGVAVEDLMQKETPKGTYLYAVVHQLGKPACELLPNLIEEALDKLPFARKMRWGNAEATFSRPVVWLSASHAGQVLPAQFAGVISGPSSRGHRFLSPEEFSIADDPSQYELRLEARKVVPDPVKRRKLILEKSRELAKGAGGSLFEHEGLLDEITQLVEWPVPLLGHFDERFLEVPKEVLISEMVEHQRYIPVTRPDGELLPCFVVVANTEVTDPERSLTGYRRVLSARFSDGAFFFREDQRTPLFERVEALSTIRFHRALGTVRDKVDRFAALSFSLAERLLRLWDAAQVRSLGTPYEIARGKVPDSSTDRLAWSLARACYLSKADLSTQMVFEFPELQGVIGAEYARRGGEPDDIALALAEHYQPRGADDGLPTGDIGALVGIADRLDTLVGIFATGKGPSGAADPYGLRRAALAIIRILRARRWHLPLKAVLELASGGLGERSKKATEEVVEEVAQFFRARLKATLVGEGMPTDVSEAALSADFDDLVDAADRTLALANLRGSSDFEPIATTFKRVANILKGTEVSLVPDGTELEAPVEIELYNAMRAVSDKVAKASAARDFPTAFGAIAELQPVVDAFFEEVMVMADDEAIRNRRLGLLLMVHQTFSPLADFTKLS